MPEIQIYDGGKLFEISTGFNDAELRDLLAGKPVTANYTDESGTIEVTVKITQKREGGTNCR